MSEPSILPTPIFCPRCGEWATYNHIDEIGQWYSCPSGHLTKTSFTGRSNEPS